jgi:hypothetical protein
MIELLTMMLAYLGPLDITTKNISNLLYFSVAQGANATTARAIVSEVFTTMMPRAKPISLPWLLGHLK